jgi:hypothetical protein
MVHVWGEHKHIGCWWGNLRERDYLEDLFVDNTVIFKRIYKKYDGWGGGLAAVNVIMNLWVP